MDILQTRDTKLKDEYHCAVDILLSLVKALCIGVYRCRDRTECRYKEELCGKFLSCFEEERRAATVVGHINSSRPIKYPN